MYVQLRAVLAMVAHGRKCEYYYTMCSMYPIFFSKNKRVKRPRHGFELGFSLLNFLNRTTSRLETRLVYRHTQKPKKLISNARLYSRLYGKHAANRYFNFVREN